MVEVMRLKVESGERRSKLEQKQRRRLQLDKGSPPEMFATLSEFKEVDRNDKGLPAQPHQLWITPIM